MYFRRYDTIRIEGYRYGPRTYADDGRRDFGFARGFRERIKTFRGAAHRREKRKHCHRSRGRPPRTSGPVPMAPYVHRGYARPDPESRSSITLSALPSAPRPGVVAGEKKITRDSCENNIRFGFPSPPYYCTYTTRSCRVVLLLYRGTHVRQ